MLSDELVPPYSRVPLSKGVLAGTEDAAAATLAELPASVELRLGAKAVALHTEQRAVELDNGTSVEFDGLVIATGARARRLAAPGQTGELVVRTIADAELISQRIIGAHSAIVVGGGFLGMEVASTLIKHGLSVTVVDRDPPLRRVLGEWLAEVLVARAEDQGLKFVLAPDGVELVGNPVSAVAVGPGTKIEADVIISAVGDLPNVEWLESSGLPITGGLIIDGACKVARGIVAAGDVAVRQISTGEFRRTPHWTSAVIQAQAAARSLLDPTTEPYRADHYFWTEQFDTDLKISGELPLQGSPRVLEGDVDDRSALLQWTVGDRPVASAALNFRMSVARLKQLAH